MEKKAFMNILKTGWREDIKKLDDTLQHTVTDYSACLVGQQVLKRIFYIAFLPFG